MSWSRERWSISLERTVWARETASSLRRHWTKDASNSRTSATQGEYSSSNARDVLAKSRVFPSVGRSPHRRTKWQASVTRGSFLRTISCPGEAERFQQRSTKSSFMQPTKPICQRRKTLTMKFWGGKQKVSMHSTGEKPVTLAETLQYTNPDLYSNVVTIITILLTCQCQPQPAPNALLARCAESRRTYVQRWKQSDSLHLPWCIRTETCPLM